MGRPLGYTVEKTRHFLPTFFLVLCCAQKTHIYTDKPTTATTKTLRAKKHFLWRIYLDHSFSREPPPTFGLRPRCILQKNMGCESWHGLQHLLLLQVIWDKVRRVRSLKSVKILGKAKCAARCPKCPKIIANFFGLTGHESCCGPPKKDLMISVIFFWFGKWTLVFAKKNWIVWETWHSTEFLEAFCGQSDRGSWDVLSARVLPLDWGFEWVISLLDEATWLGYKDKLQGVAVIYLPGLFGMMAPSMRPTWPTALLCHKVVFVVHRC